MIGNNATVSHPEATGSSRRVRLRYVDQCGPGLTRRQRGRGVEYLDPAGKRVDDETAERIRRLAIPPAWKDVWICPWSNGPSFSSIVRQLARPYGHVPEGTGRRPV